MLTLSYLVDRKSCMVEVASVYVVSLHYISAYKPSRCIELFIGYVIILMDVLHLVTGDET